MPPADSRRRGQRLAASLLDDGYRVWVQVSGNSMLPTLRSGDRVELAPVSLRAPRRGDVVLITTRGGGLALHRLLRAWGRPWRRVQTRGDNLWRLDDAVDIDRVHGVLVAVERGRCIVPTRDGVCRRLTRVALALIASGLRYRRASAGR